MIDLTWMYQDDPADDAAEAENTADEAEAHFDEQVRDVLYPADEF